MAEGVVRDLYGDICLVFSAGTKPSFVHSNAIIVMNEIGIDISSHTSNSVKEYLSKSFDVVVTVCDDAKENCPILLGTHTKLHWKFEDPADSKELDRFREIRDQIKETFQDKFGEFIT